MKTSLLGLHAPSARQQLRRFAPTKLGILSQDVLREFQKTLKEKVDDHSSFIDSIRASREDALDSGFPELKDGGMRDGGRNDDNDLLVENSKNERAKALHALRRVENDLRGKMRSSSLLPFGKCTKPGCGEWIEAERLKTLPDEPICLAHCGCVGEQGPHRN